MKASSYFGGQYLSANDLDDKQVTVKINAITSEVFEGRDGKGRERIVLHVDKLSKPIVVNATNGDRLIQEFGDETDTWINRSVMVTKGKVMFAGQRFDSIIMSPVSKSK